MTDDAADWRDDPGWKLVWHDGTYYVDGRDPPRRPPPEAELAQPAIWASLYVGNRLVATWTRVTAA